MNRVLSTIGDSGPLRPARTPRCRGAPVVRAVLEATLDELAQVGYGALNVERVAARAGVNKTTVYRRWPTRTALVEAALRSFVEALPDLEPTGDIRADLLAVARRMCRCMSSPRGRCVQRMLLAGDGAPDLLALVGAIRAEVEAPARDVIECAVARGDLRAGTDAGLVLNTLAGWLVHTLFRERVAASEERLRAVVELLLGGALAARGQERRRLPPTG